MAFLNEEILGLMNVARGILGKKGPSQDAFRDLF